MRGGYQGPPGDSGLPGRDGEKGDTGESGNPVGYCCVCVCMFVSMCV